MVMSLLVDRNAFVKQESEPLSTINEFSDNSNVYLLYSHGVINLEDTYVSTGGTLLEVGNHNCVYL